MVVWRKKKPRHKKVRKSLRGQTLKIDSSAVQTLIEKRISPLMALDGANIELLSVDDEEKVITVRFNGSYRGSPCRSIVLDYVILPILKQELDTAIQVKMAD